MGAYAVGSVPIPSGMMAVVVEEVTKWGVLQLGRKWLGWGGWKQGLVVGLFFGLTELVLYAPQLWEAGAGVTWGARALWTVPMHALTGALVGGSKWGILLAIVVHGLFNLWIGSVTMF